MFAILNPLSFIITCVAGWFNQHQQSTIDYLGEAMTVSSRATAT